MNTNKTRNYKLLAFGSIVFALLMIFLNFLAGITCKSGGHMLGTPSLFSLMFGGFTGFKIEETGYTIRALNLNPGLLTAFIFEIIAVVFLVLVFVGVLLNKGNSKGLKFLAYFSSLLILVSVILVVLTKTTTLSVLINQIDDQLSSPVKNKIIETYKANYNNGIGVYLTSVFGVLSAAFMIMSLKFISKSTSQAVVGQ